VIVTCALFGFCALGWNGVYIAAIARRAPSGTIGHATGGSLVFTYAGVIVTPPAFAALHDRAGLSYGTAFGALALVSAVGIACVVLAWRARIRADAASGDLPYPFQRSADASSLERASTQRVPCGVSSFFQKGARVLR
jgi:hypothetical protein